MDAYFSQELETQLARIVGRDGKYGAEEIRFRAAVLERRGYAARGEFIEEEMDTLFAQIARY